MPLHLQVCLLDLEFGLPVQVRDQALGVDGNTAIPKSDVNREYFAEEADRKAAAGIDFDSSFGKTQPSDTILKLQRTTPYYKRNRAHVCSFFVRGECTRGAECPYRHEMPLTGELSQQNIKDRYYGVNDPVANKLMRKVGEMPSLEPPADETIRTMYVGGLDERIQESDLRDQFYAYGEIETIRVLPAKGCAFVAYTTREGAEKAAQSLAHKLVVKGLRLNLMWGRPLAPRPQAQAIESQPPAPRPAPPPGERASLPMYPSMDPLQMGSVGVGRVEKEGGGGEGEAPVYRHFRPPPPMQPPPFYPQPHAHHYMHPPPYPPLGPGYHGRTPPPHYPPPQFQQQPYTHGPT